jgi:hypothetical protein
MRFLRMRPAQYEIDSSEKNAKRFDKAMSPFVAAARRVDRTATAPTVPPIRI